MERNKLDATSHLVPSFRSSLNPNMLCLLGRIASWMKCTKAETVWACQNNKKGRTAAIKINKEQQSEPESKKSNRIFFISFRNDLSEFFKLSPAWLMIGRCLSCKWRVILYRSFPRMDLTWLMRTSCNLSLRGWHFGQGVWHLPDFTEADP